MEHLIITIMHLAYLVHSRTNYCVFINFSGHVNNLEVSIRKSRAEWQTKVLKTEFYTEYIRLSRSGDPLALLNAKIAILKRILDEGNIPYEECDVEQIYSEQYSF